MVSFEPACAFHDVLQMFFIFYHKRKVDWIRCPAIAVGCVERDVIVANKEMVQTEHRRNNKVGHQAIDSEQGKKDRESIIGRRPKYLNERMERVDTKQ